jgi:hemerythrin-like domain-containing protein
VISVSADSTANRFRGKEIMNSEPYADIREMYMAHTMFRREFGLLPALISGVSPADAARARVIAQHFALIRTVLHHHHLAEDTYLWPRLASRAPADAAPVVAAMEAQHGELDKVIDDVTAGLRDWEETADPAHGAALAEAADRLRSLLAGHLAAEEEQALPLIARYVTAAEWGEMVAAGAGDVEPEQMPLIFGLMMYEGDPEVIGEAIEHMPPDVRQVLPVLAAEAFARHAELVHGTAAPAKSGAL